MVEPNTVLFVAAQEAVFQTLDRSNESRRSNRNMLDGCHDILAVMTEEASDEMILRGDMSATAMDMKALREGLLSSRDSKRTAKTAAKYLDHLTSHQILTRRGDTWFVNPKRVLSLAIDYLSTMVSDMIERAVSDGYSREESTAGVENVGASECLREFKSLLAEIERGESAIIKQG